MGSNLEQFLNPIYGFVWNEYGIQNYSKFNEHQYSHYWKYDKALIEYFEKDELFHFYFRAKELTTKEKKTKKFKSDDLEQSKKNGWIYIGSLNLEFRDEVEEKVKKEMKKVEKEMKKVEKEMKMLREQIQIEEGKFVDLTSEEINKLKELTEKKKKMMKMMKKELTEKKKKMMKMMEKVIVYINTKTKTKPNRRSPTATQYSSSWTKTKFKKEGKKYIINPLINIVVHDHGRIGIKISIYEIDCKSIWNSISNFD